MNDDQPHPFYHHHSLPNLANFSIYLNNTNNNFNFGLVWENNLCVNVARNFSFLDKYGNRKKANNKRILLQRNDEISVWKSALTGFLNEFDRV